VQDGSAVLATASGSLNLTGLTDAGTGSGLHGVSANIAYLTLGPGFSISGEEYTGLTGPTSFGTGGAVFASSATGDDFILAGGGGYFVVPEGYSSGQALSATSTFSAETIAGLGLTPGTYTYTLPDDTITVQIGSAAVPEPATIVLVASAAPFALIAWLRRRKRG
jgi:hypothetical protein